MAGNDKKILDHMSSKMDALLEAINTVSKGFEVVYSDHSRLIHKSEEQDRRIDELRDALEKIYKQNVKLAKKQKNT